MSNYIQFLFDEDGTLKSRYAPVVTTNKDGSFLLKYSVPGYHSPRQYFKFDEIPSSFPNEFVSEIFRVFSITNSFLFRRPHNKIPSHRVSIVNDFFGIIPAKKSYSEDEIEIAQYNLNLAIKLGRERHSLFYFDSYLDAYRILHPELRYSSSVIRSIQAGFNKLIS